MGTQRGKKGLCAGEREESDADSGWGGGTETQTQRRGGSKRLSWRAGPSWPEGQESALSEARAASARAPTGLPGLKAAERRRRGPRACAGTRREQGARGAPAAARPA